MFKLGCLSTLLEIGKLKHTSNTFLTLRGDLFRSKPTVRDVSGSFLAVKTWSSGLIYNRFLKINSNN